MILSSSISNCESGTHLVDIHVTLCSTTSLEHNQREMIDQLSRDDLSITPLVNKLNRKGRCNTHFVGSFTNSVPNLRIQAVRNINSSCSLLEYTECFDERWWEPFCRSAYIEILEGTVCVGG
jgi:hypothetical protein